MLALDDILEDSSLDVEFLHMCPQGEEYAVLEVLTLLALLVQNYKC
jgi:hypothetical protein